MTIKLWAAAILMVSFAATFTAKAEDTAPAGAATQPWLADQTLLQKTIDAIHSGGVLAVEPISSDIEQALTNAKTTWEDGHGNAYVLTDGETEVIVGMGLAATENSLKSQHVIAVNNPYPPLALYLGSYYNETQHPEDALRVLDKGLALSAVAGMDLGDHRPVLLSERGAALIALKRWPDALADYDEGLKIEDLKPTDAARLQRGRGFALTELGRLDEAEAAYKESLKLVPDNDVAAHELAYIARLRAGAAPTASALKLVQPQAPQNAPSPGSNSATQH